MSSDYIIEPAFGEEFPRPKMRRIWRNIFVVLIVSIAITSSYLLSRTAAPKNFPEEVEVIIEPGMGVREIAQTLKEADVIRSSWMLYAVIMAQHNPSELKASIYRFTEPLSVFAVAEKLTKGDFENDLISFTHIEGESVEDTALRAETVLRDFDTATFISLGTPFEGRVFPDTYKIRKNFTAAELLALMQKNYEEKIGPLRPRIQAAGLRELDVIIMASIIEREANSPESMKMVAGILHNRLQKGMYLQVDASIEYALHKTLQELTPEDLEMDSPYNTYKYPGLPPTPIGNPGLTAIEAVIDPTPSPYYFYLTDENGVFHYATTFDEHKQNIAAYLR